MLRLSQTDGDLATRLGRELAEHELYPKAVAAFEHVLRLKPYFSEVYYDLSLSYFHNRQFRESLQTLDRIADVRHHDARYFTLLGLNYRELGDLARAVANMRRALNRDHIYNLGITLLRTDGIPEAFNLFQKASRSFPLNADLLYGLGVASFYLGMNEEAHQHFTESIRLQPKKAQFYASLGDVYAVGGHYENAQQAYASAISLEPANPDFRVKAGRNLLKLQQQDEARSAFQNVLESDARNAEAHYNLGKITASAGDCEGAVSHLERAVALDPTLKEAHYQLGLAYRRLGEKGKAAEALGRFRKLKQADNLAETERHVSTAPKL